MATTDGSYPHVRRAQKADADALGALWNDLLDTQSEMDDRLNAAPDALERWQNDFPVWLEDETHRIYVAENDDGDLVGFLSAHRWGPPPIYEDSSEVYLDELYVAPDARRSGYGTELVTALRTWTERIGAQRIRLSVLHANDDGRAFWESLEAVPMTLRMTIEMPDGTPDDGKDEGSTKIGFQGNRA